MSTFDRSGALAVSVSSTLSFTAILALGSFVTYLLLRHRGVSSDHVCKKSGVRFLRSQAGQLFLNLLVADFIQAFGFGLSWLWYHGAAIDGSNGACTIQGLAIQAGDVASAVFSLFIAIHTAIFIAGAWKPKAATLNWLCAGAWAFVVVITALGPLAIQKSPSGDFYGIAGNWCWITTSYEDERLSLHYVFIFISAIGQLVSYCAIFIILRFRAAFARRSTRRASEETMIGCKSGVTAQSELASPALSRKLDRTSFVMLAYPMVNLTVILPLSVYRLSALAGNTGSPQLLAGCGFIFSLGGFANVLLYSLTRKILTLPVHGQHDVAQQAQLETVETKIKSNWGSPDSDMTKVERRGPSPTPTFVKDSRLKELRLCPPSRGSANLLVRPDSGLLPPLQISKPGMFTRKSSSSRPASPISPVSTISGINVSQETIVRIED